MTTVVLLSRMLLAAVFVVSAVAKLRDRPGSRRAVGAFGVPTTLVASVATGLPVVELAIAALLVSDDPSASLGALAGLLILAGFTVAIVVNLRRGNRVDCHCFGQIGAARIGWTTVARNGGLIVLALVSLTGVGSLGSVPSGITDYKAPQIAVGVVFFLLAGAVFVLATVVRTLATRYGGVLLRLEALEMVTGTAAPEPAPHFALADLEGRVVDLDDVLSQQKPTLVAFISPGCVLCDQLLPDFERWQQPDAPLSVVVLSNGTTQANRDKLAGRSVGVLLDADEVARAYGMRGTPAAYLLGVDGLFAAPTAYGVEAVRALHDRTARTVTGSHDHGLHQIGPRPVSVGDPLPDLLVTNEDGVDTSLGELVDDEAVLLFWRSSCSFCAAIAEDVAALESGTRLVLMTGTDTTELRATGLQSPLARESDSAVSAALQIQGTPSAVHVRAGRVASPVAVGGPAVLALLARDPASEAASGPGPRS